MVEVAVDGLLTGVKPSNDGGNPYKFVNWSLIKKIHFE
jgi:hypothetical protein